MADIPNSPGGFLVFDIGCIECGEDSDVVGFYPTKAEADAVADNYAVGEDDPRGPGRWGRQEWHGEHHVRVFEL